MCAKFLNSNYLSVTFSLKSVKQHKRKKILHSDVILTKHPHIHFILPSVSKVVVEMNIFLFNKLFFFPICAYPASLVAQSVKNLRAVQETGFDPWVGKIPWRRKWQPTPVSLPGKISWTEEPGGLKSMGLQRVRHDWATNTYLLTG